jgi:hypothetical protein
MINQATTPLLEQSELNLYANGKLSRIAKKDLVTCELHMREWHLDNQAVCAVVQAAQTACCLFWRLSVSMDVLFRFE